MLNAALAGPVVLQQPVDPFVRCVEEANVAAGLSTQSAVFDSTIPQGVDKLAVVVGVPCHRSPSVPSLAYSTRDAVRMAEMLAEGGFTVVSLTSAVDVHQLLDTLHEAEEQMDPNGVLVVYFSGHGVLRQREGRLERYLVFSDTSLTEIEGTALSVVALQDQIQAIDAKHRVVLHDTCFAGTPNEGGKALQILGSAQGRTKGFAAPEPDRDVAPADQRLFASRFFEQALESVAHQGSVYTHHFLSAVSDPVRADLDGDDCIGTLEAHTYATRKTALERDGFQNPQLQASAAENVPLSCAAEPTRGVFFRRSDPGAAQSLEPGRHKLVLTEVPGRKPREVSVKIEAGAWVAAEDLDRARAPYVLVNMGLGASSVGSPATATPSGSAWLASRETGVGRVATGATVDWITKAPATEMCGRFHGSRSHASVGWWGSLGRLTAGPVASLGLTSRTAYDACDGETFDTYTAITGGLGVHSHVTFGPVALVVDVAANSLPERRNDQTVFQVKPSVTGGLGFQF